MSTPSSPDQTKKQTDIMQAHLRAAQLLPACTKDQVFPDLSGC